MTGIDAAHGRHIGIAPSILTADFGRLAEQIRDAEAGGAGVDGDACEQAEAVYRLDVRVRLAVGLQMED